MSDPSLIHDPAALQPSYLPESFVDREHEQARLNDVVSARDEPASRNLLIHGARGTGKTHLALKHVEAAPNPVTTCYVPCHRCNTQYQVLKRVVSQLTDEEVSDGYHSTALQRTLRSQVEALDAIIILDELDFLLLQDGDDLLYYFSRTPNISTVLISANHAELDPHLDERTLSRLQPDHLQLQPYSAEELYRILERRVQQSFKPQSLQREALTYIATRIGHPTHSLHWLRTAAEAASDAVTVQTVTDTQSQASRRYTMSVLDEFSEHHRLLYQAVMELTHEDTPPFQTGQIYARYQALAESYSVETLSTRRISDFLKHLELLNLVEADYYYGGQKGKTREIRLRQVG